MAIRWAVLIFMVAAVIGCFRDSTPNLRDQATPALVAKIAEVDSSDRQEIAKVLASRPDAWPLLKEKMVVHDVLVDRSRYVQIVELYPESFPKAPMTLTHILLSDPVPGMRNAAVSALQRYSGDAVVDEIVRSITPNATNDTIIQGLAALAGESGDKAFTYFLKWVDHPNDEVRSGAYRNLALTRTHRAMDFLKKRLSREKGAVKSDLANIIRIASREP
jgi:hypothetical protein